MKVLITGAAGFIGYHLVKNLCEAGHEVTGIDNFQETYEKKLKFVRLDCLQHRNFIFHESGLDLKNLPQKKFDLIIHLAARAGVRSSEGHEHSYIESNILGFKSIVDLCVKSNTKLIYASSSSVYADDSIIPFSEEKTLLQPKSFYGLTKMFNEQYASLKVMTSGLSALGLRFFSVYGPFGRPDMAYFSFARNIMRSEKIYLYDKGKKSRDMTYISDIIDGINLAINYIFTEEKVNNEIFNLGNNSPISALNLLNSLESKLGKKARVEHLNNNMESLNTHADLRISSSVLGYNPVVNVSDGLDYFLDWLIKYE